MQPYQEGHQVAGPLPFPILDQLTPKLGDRVYNDGCFTAEARGDRFHALTSLKHTNNNCGKGLVFLTYGNAHVERFFDRGESHAKQD